MANLHDKTPTSKQQKPSSSDKISGLPDDVIHLILSFVPTKHAVATSILSKRWLSLWTLVPILDLENASVCSTNEQSQQKFIQFVSNVLKLNKSDSLEKFRLKCYPSYINPSHINKWVCSATERGLQELDISISKIKAYYGVYYYRWKLPSNFFNVISMLKVLKLSDRVLVDVPGTVSFPNLKILHLVSVKYGDYRSVHNLFSGCLVLQELLIKRNPKDNVLNFIISIPTLNSLSIELLGLKERYVEINAPALEYLNLKDDFSSHDLLAIILCSTIDMNYWLCKRTTEILRVICSVKSLFLSGNIWCSEPENDYNPMFVNLVQLELNVGLYGWNVLLLFLENSHILQVLVLTVSEASQVGDEQGRSLPKHVPTCFLSHLETVCFRTFSGKEHELRLIEYILTNARVLKTMTICTYGSFSDSDFLVHKKLSMIPRCSETCQLEFKCQ